MDALIAVTMEHPRPFVRVYLQDGIERRVPVGIDGILNTDAIEALSKMAGRELDDLARIYGWVKVVLFEYEEGAGGRADDILYFLARASARNWVQRYNEQSGLVKIEGWSMRAVLVEWSRGVEEYEQDIDVQ